MPVIMTMFSNSLRAGSLKRYALCMAIAGTFSVCWQGVPPQLSLWAMEPRRLFQYGLQVQLVSKGGEGAPLSVKGAALSVCNFDQ